LHPLQVHTTHSSMTSALNIIHNKKKKFYFTLFFYFYQNGSQNWSHLKTWDQSKCNATNLFYNWKKHPLMSKFLFIFIMKISILTSHSIQLLIFFIEKNNFLNIISDFFFLLHFFCFKRKIRKICLFLHYRQKLKWRYRGVYCTSILWGRVVILWWGGVVKGFNATFNNISVMSWQLVLSVEEGVVPGENHRPVASHWQTLSYNAVSSTNLYEQDSNSQL